MVVSVRYPEVAHGSSLNLDAMRSFQSVAEGNFNDLDSRLTQMEIYLGEMLRTTSWLKQHHPDAMREYHATQLALHTFEEPPTPAP